MELERRNINMTDIDVSDKNICWQEIHMYVHKDANMFYIWFKYDKAKNIFLRYIQIGICKCLNLNEI